MLKWFKKGSEDTEQPWEEQEADLLRNPYFGSIELLPSCDSLPDAYGPFGSVTNPIPVNGVGGEIIYINRLRTKAGRGFFYHRPGSWNSDLSPHPLDGYELLSIDGESSCTLWFSPYHPRRSTLVPAGLTLLPFPKNETEKIIIRTPGFGTNIAVNDFPAGLPAVVEERLNHEMPDLGSAMARRIVDALSKIDLSYKIDWAKGPVSLILHEADGQTFVLIVDEEDQVIDSISIHAEFDAETLLLNGVARLQQGHQALLTYAQYDMRKLTPEEKAGLHQHFNVDIEDDEQFALYFCLAWLTHELQNRPKLDGSFGMPAQCLRRIRWYDLPVVEGMMTKDLRELLNRLQEQRLADLP